MEYLFELGFLGTRASYYMDFIILYFLSLPFLIFFSIWFATLREYRLHHLSQLFLLVGSFFALFLFHYALYIQSDLKLLSADSSISYSTILYVYSLNAVLSLVTLIIWTSTLLFAAADRRRRALPGFYTRSHKKTGQKTFLFICLMILSMFLLYWMIYIA